MPVFSATPPVRLPASRYLLAPSKPSAKSFIIRTCKTVSKQSTLTPFRINTYEKTGVGGRARMGAPSGFPKRNFQLLRIPPLPYTEPMPNHYLLKTEPSEYSFANLQKDKKTVWDGVHNPVALRNLAGMKPGDRLIINR